MKTLQVVLALGLLILIHEFGHFFFAKLFGIKVDKFYLFFDAWGVKLFSTKSKWFLKICPKAAEWETEYGIGWLPLGGYCKIAGMIDESMDTEQMKSEPQPWEFRSKPAWQRLFVMAGGVLFNFLLAIVLYISILGIWGESYVSNDGKQVYVNELASDMGFKTGDHIISFDEYKPENFNMLQADLAREMAQKAVVLRDGDTLDIYLDQSRIGEVLKTPGMFDLAMPFVIDSVPATSANVLAGLEKGDRIISVSGTATDFVQDAWKVFEVNTGQAVEAEVLRGADTLAMTLQVDTTGRVGVLLVKPEVSTKEYGFLAAIPAGFKKTFTTIGGYLKDLKLVFTPKTEAYKSVGSFISIGQIFPSHWDWHIFLNISALLSVMLGVMNLIPIPALDGGHIMFTLYEIITRRKPSDKFLEIMQIIGMILIFGLMILAFGNDIIKLFR